jgi:hypothetical protein
MVVSSIYSSRKPNENGIWENQGDLDNEITVQNIIEQKSGWTLTKQQTTDPMDYIAFVSNQGRTKTVALVEMRARSMQHDKYNEMFFCKEKFIKLNQIAHALWIPALLFITFTDGIRWIDLTKVIRPKTTYGDRGKMAVKRATDNAPVVLLPINRMKVL